MKFAWYLDITPNRMFSFYQTAPYIPTAKAGGFTALFGNYFIQKKTINFNNLLPPG